MTDFFKKAFQDMKDSAQAQREVDKANFAAAKAEAKANFEEAKANSSIEAHKAVQQAKRDAQMDEALQRKADAEKRIESAQGKA